MSDYEEYSKKFKRDKKFVLPLFIHGRSTVKYINYKNVVTEGPNIIVANHPVNIGRDVAGLLDLHNRPLHFASSKFMFDKKELMEYIKSLAPKLYPLFKPLLSPFVGFITRKMHEYEMIPIEWRYDGNKKTYVRKLRKSVDMMKDYLLDGRAIVIFQYHSDMQKNILGLEDIRRDMSEYHPYIPKFNNTVGKIVNELYKEHNLRVPVTPISIKGNKGNLKFFKKMVFNVGEPMYMDHNVEKPVNVFTDQLEERVANLLIESGFDKDYKF